MGLPSCTPVTSPAIGNGANTGARLPRNPSHLQLLPNCQRVSERKLLTKIAEAEVDWPLSFTTRPKEV